MSIAIGPCVVPVIVGGSGKSRPVYSSEPSGTTIERSPKTMSLSWSVVQSRLATRFALLRAGVEHDERSLFAGCDALEREDAGVARRPFDGRRPHRCHRAAPERDV